MDDELPSGVEAVVRVLAVLVMVAGQVVALGGVWAAWTGNDFLFWSFAEEGPSVGNALLILFVGEPVVMFGAYLVFMLLAMALSLPFMRRRR
jgi:hypothetical protein